MRNAKTVDGQMRANYQGFFQEWMSVSPAFHGRGFQVACGPSGVDGIAGMGHVYSFVVRARETDGSGALNSGTVTCPANNLVRIFLPLVSRH